MAASGAVRLHRAGMSCSTGSSCAYVDSTDRWSPRMVSAAVLPGLLQKKAQGCWAVMD